MDPRQFDPDQRAVVDALRNAISASGLTRKEFAQAIGTSASRLSTYVHGDTVPAATLLMRAQRISAALASAHAVSATPPSTQHEHLHDTLRNRRHLAAAWDIPASTGSTRWDTLLGAIVEHEFTAAGLAAPAWSHTDPLPEEWFPATGRLSETDVRAQTPEWLSLKRIFLTESALAGV